MKNSLTEVRFQFFSIKFTPYKDKPMSSTAILREIVNYVGNLKSEGKGVLIDRNENRAKGNSREMFVNRAVYMHKVSRVRCSIALLRTGVKPKIKPKDKFTLEPLSSIKGTIAEETHFFIDYSLQKPILCMQFNNHGARYSDVEYYFRQIAKSLKIATATKMEMYMDVPLDETLENLRNVLKLDIKLQPKNFAKIDTHLVGTYFSGMNLIGQKLQPEYLKVETSFYTPGKGIRSKELNKQANNMVVDLLRTFQGRSFHIDLFDNFVVEYEDKQGMDQVFNLLKGKKEIIKEIEIDSIKKSSDWYVLIEEELDQFIEENEK
jgi:hypothetical protein